MRHLKAFSILALAYGVVGCGQPGATASERADSTGQAIYGGEHDNDGGGDDSTVALRIDLTSHSYKLCTGTLVAPNVVLTARHCVSKETAAEVICDENGTSYNGDHVGEDEKPDAIHVYMGTSPNFRKDGGAHIKRIFHPEGRTLCNQDIALIVLDNDMKDGKVATVRLRTKTEAGENIRAVGYGQDEGHNVGVRRYRKNIPIMGVGPVITQGSTPIANQEFEVGLSICQGDSGGPAYSEETGAVIGVVSRGISCSADHGHIYTLTSGFVGLFAAAFAEANVTLTEEVRPSGKPTSNAGGPTNSSSSGELLSREGDGGTNNASPQTPKAACNARFAGGTSTTPHGILYALAIAAVTIARRKRTRG